MIDPTGAAKAIRKELKALYPSAKFKVRTKHFSMGNSVDVFCPHEIDPRDVQKILDKYEYGRFDGMTDLSYSEYNPNLPQAKYVSANPWSDYV